MWSFPIWIFAFWQFRIRDSSLAIFWGVFAIALTFFPLVTALILSIFKARKRSSASPGISKLYTKYGFFHSVGALYRPYRQKFHWFWFVFVLAIIARSGFIAFGPQDGFAQVIGCVVVEAIVFVGLLVARPHKDKKGDWLVSFLAFCRMAAFGLLIAFLPRLNVAPITRTIIGFVIIVLFGIPVILLLLGLIYNLGRYIYSLKSIWLIIRVWMVMEETPRPNRRWNGSRTIRRFRRFFPQTSNGPNSTSVSPRCRGQLCRPQCS